MHKAVVCRSLGRPEALALEQVESRPLAPGEVRVAIHAAGVNFPDLLMTEGRYRLEGDRAALLGIEPDDVEALYTPKSCLSSPLAVQLGAEIEEGPLGPLIRTDADNMTTVFARRRTASARPWRTASRRESSPTARSCSAEPWT